MWKSRNPHLWQSSSLTDTRPDMDEKRILELIEHEEGLQQAFNLIIRTYSERLYLTIRRMVNCHEDADDILQDTFIKVWNAIPTFRGDSGIYTWIFRIALNTTLTFLRKEKARAFLSLTNYEAYVDSRMVGDDSFDGNELQRLLHKAISLLPPKQRLVFTLRYFEEMPYERIAEALGGTTGSLKASYHHAYVKITQWLKQNNCHPE